MNIGMIFGDEEVIKELRKASTAVYALTKIERFLIKTLKPNKVGHNSLANPYRSTTFAGKPRWSSRNFSGMKNPVIDLII
jgi:hypothetical protein